MSTETGHLIRTQLVDSEHEAWGSGNLLNSTARCVGLSAGAAGLVEAETRVLCECHAARKSEIRTARVAWIRRG